MYNSYNELNTTKGSVDTKNDKINGKLIKEIISLYEKVDGIYGYIRITMNINRKLNSQYNHKRLQKRLNSMSPLEYRSHAA